MSERHIIGRVKVKTHDEASYLDPFFNGMIGYNRLTNITRGKEYDVVNIEGLNDCQDYTIIDDSGKEQTLANFFFNEIEWQ